MLQSSASRCCSIERVCIRRASILFESIAPECLLRESRSIVLAGDVAELVDVVGLIGLVGLVVIDIRGAL